MTILQSKENCNAAINADAKGDPVKKQPEKIKNISEGENEATNDIVRSGLKEEIAKQVVRKKLAKLRHLVLEKAFSPEYLDSLFPSLLEHFEPQRVVYNGGIANIKEWKVRARLSVKLIGSSRCRSCFGRAVVCMELTFLFCSIFINFLFALPQISCYLEVMNGGVPTTNPNTKLLHLFQPLLDICNDLFLYWFRQKSACNKASSNTNFTCSRLMTFITRYTPAPGEQALLKVINYNLWCRSCFLI